jgi:hypothetical protein
MFLYYLLNLVVHSYCFLWPCHCHWLKEYPWQYDPAKLNFSELRAREIKVKKVEEQLKVKDKSLLEIRNEKIVLETRCQQLESRNFELEQTVKLLKRRLESDNHLAAPPTHHTCKPPVISGRFAPNPVHPVSRFAPYSRSPQVVSPRFHFAPGRFALIY